MMKTLIGIVLVSGIFWASSCGKPSEGNSLNGKWRGYVTQRGKSALVELELMDKHGTIEGTFTILSETGEDIEKGMSFHIVQAQRSNNNLKFIVPVFEGQVDDDAIAFELLIEGKSLKGHGHELRKGSEKIVITFTKQE